MANCLPNFTNMKVLEFHCRRGGDPVFVIAEKIISFRSYHHIGRDWQYSTITLENSTVEVRENAVEIIAAIYVSDNGNHCLSEDTLEEVFKHPSVKGFLMSDFRKSQL